MAVDSQGVVVADRDSAKGAPSRLDTLRARRAGPSSGRHRFSRRMPSRCQRRTQSSYDTLPHSRYLAHLCCSFDSLRTIRRAHSYTPTTVHRSTTHGASGEGPGGEVAMVAAAGAHWRVGAAELPLEK